MKIYIKNIIWLLLAAIAISGCSKMDENYKKLEKGGEIIYPGVISGQNYLAGNLRTMLIWHPSPDPKIVTYKIYWNNKQDSLTVTATDHNPADTVKVLIPNLVEGTYSFNVYSIDDAGHVSIPLNINSVRVFGAVYESALFNRGYNADTPFIVNILTGTVQLKFNPPDSINIKTVINYTDNANKTHALILKPDSNTITLPDFQFGSNVTFQSSYIPLKGAIDTFTVQAISTYPTIKRIGDITALYIKNPGNPFLRSDVEHTDKWGYPLYWSYNTNVLNQDGDTRGGWSTDNNGCIHFEAENYSGNGVNNGKVYQTFTLPAGNYAIDVQTAGYGGSINANEVVAAGTSLPDITALSTGNTLAWFHGDQNSIGGSHTLNFTLTQNTTVTFGWVVSTDSYTYLQFTSVKLRSL
jgi:hypothetical protein